MHKNICLIAFNLYGGGVERVTLSLARALSKLNCRVEVVLFNNEQLNLDAKNFNFGVHIINRRKHPILSIQDVKNATALKAKITEIRVDFDLIVSNSFELDRICNKANLKNTHYCLHNALSGVIKSRFNGKKGLIATLRRKHHTHLRKKLYTGQNLISVSKGVEQDLIKFGVRPKTLRTIYNPFDFDSIQQQANAHLVKEQNYIVHVGRFCRQKRHDILIKAYQQSGVKQKLLLLGDHSIGTGKDMQQLVDKLGLQDQVVFKGWVENPFPYIKNAQALVLSSDYEGFGMVLVEALALKTPAISTNCASGPNEILIDELSSFLSPVQDVGALAKNIKCIVNTPVQITKKYTDRFDEKNAAKQYLSLCD